MDIFDEPEVLWAVATRTKFPDDAIIIPDIIAEGLDPMGTDTGLITKVGIGRHSSFVLQLAGGA